MMNILNFGLYLRFDLLLMSFFYIHWSFCPLGFLLNVIFGLFFSKFCILL